MHFYLIRREQIVLVARFLGQIVGALTAKDVIHGLRMSFGIAGYGAIAELSPIMYFPVPQVWESERKSKPTPSLPEPSIDPAFRVMLG